MPSGAGEAVVIIATREVIQRLASHRDLVAVLQSFAGSCIALSVAICPANNGDSESTVVTGFLQDSIVQPRRG